jgi:hypothetical protein
MIRCNRNPADSKIRRTSCLVRSIPQCDNNDNSEDLPTIGTLPDGMTRSTISSLDFSPIASRSSRPDSAASGQAEAEAVHEDDEIEEWRKCLLRQEVAA